MLLLKYISPLFLLIISATIANSQESSFEKVSKQYSLVLSLADNTKSTYDNISKIGFGIELDYAWKLSGYNKKKNVYFSIPIGYQQFISAQTKDLKVLFYGWSVRHELRKNRKWTPFLSYSLLLNQTWFDKIKGSNMGHQTRFSIGLNRRIKDKLLFTIIINYSFIRIPSLNNEKADRINRISIGSGFRFGR